jgi:hypothetical protein
MTIALNTATDGHHHLGVSRTGLMASCMYGGIAELSVRVTRAPGVLRGSDTLLAEW